MIRTLRDIAATLIALAFVVGVVSLAVAHPPSERSVDPVSSVIFPPQTLPLRFSHAAHLQAVDMDCEGCHERAPGSLSSLDNLIPREEVCATCHPIDRDQPYKEVDEGRGPARCDACHAGFDAATGFVERVRIPAPNLKFNHRAHVSRGVTCTACHGDLVAEKVDLATREQLPKMQLCLGCHDGSEARDECTTCHLAEAGGVMKTRFAGGQLAPSGSILGAAHDLSFRSDHKFAAQGREDYCGACHRKSFCVDCHNGTIKPMEFHLGDYITLHPIEARRNSPDCSSCHRQQTFCVGCHSRSGVAADQGGSEYLPPSSGDASRGFHPPGWVEYDSGLVAGEGTRGMNHHSFEAQRNIRQCAACHRESFCVGCHSRQPGSFNVSPHPKSWLGSRRCKSLAARAGRMCLRCHIDPRELDCDRPIR